jgi:hypothetical protein
MSEDDLGLWVADVLNRCEGGSSGLQGRVVGQTNILRGVDENTASDEAGVFTGMD